MIARCPLPRATQPPSERPLKKGVRAPLTVDRRSRIQRWIDTIAMLTELQAEYGAWLETLPDNQQDGATAEALRTIVEFDLSELQAIEPPRGFGRD
jgi:hypothetical protein